MLPRINSSVLQSFSLRPVLVVPFLLQILVAVGLVGYFSFRNGQRAVDQLVLQLVTKASQQVDGHLDTYLALPIQLTEINADAIANQELNLDNLEASGRYFWRQARSFRNISYVGYALPDGREAGAGRWVEGIDLLLYENQGNAQASDYVADAEGNRAELLQTYNFNPLNETWYQETVTAGRLIWGSVEAAEIDEVEVTEEGEALRQPDTAIAGGLDYYFAISAAAPVYQEDPTSQQQRLLGVTSVEVLLPSVSEFLKDLQVSPSAQIFVIERDGMLIGSSSQHPILYQDQNEVKQYSALDTPDPLIQSVGQTLQHHFNTFQNVQSYQNLDLIVEGQRHFVHVEPWTGPGGLDWVIVVAVPASDFMTQIEQNTRTTILLSFAALGFSVALGLYTSRWIAQPILNLSRAAAAIANGNLEQTVSLSKVRELRILGHSFNHMTQQLKASFTALEQTNEQLEYRVEERTCELKIAKEDAEKAKAIADTANQAKSEFLANMSHELRTPLNGILGYAQILERSKTLNDKERHGIEVIYQCGTHLLTLINDVLDLAKIEARKLELAPTPVHFPAFLQGVVEICQVRAKQKRIEFIYQPSDSLPEGIYTDAKRLRQVLLNLLGNAIKFTDAGSVTFKVEAIAQQSDPLSSEILFQVEDTGVGISPADLERLFQVFEQVGDRKRQAEGTGLGLAVSQQIVHLMDGQIQVKSQAGVGSDFYFTLTLPIAEDWAQQHSSRDGKTIVGYQGDRRRLLVVDDGWENRTVLRNLLEPLGFDMHEAEDGQQGIEQIQQLKPDLVITDLAMPTMDGFEMLKQVRQSGELCQQKIIVSSASVSEIDQQMAIDAGGDDFLPKPVDANQLFHQLEHHLQLQWNCEAVEIQPRTQNSSVGDSQEHSNSVEMIVPPRQVLHTLLEIAQQAKLKRLKEQLDALAQNNPEYHRFIAPILELCGQFKAEEIEALLQRHLGDIH